MGENVKIGRHGTGTQMHTPARQGLDEHSISTVDRRLERS
jgi:hypothetical protein